MADYTPVAPGRIFLSYRRAETDFPAGWLYERLAARFGRDQVFKDVDSIELGDEFAEVIANAVGSCDVLLALIGNQWLTITDEAGNRRLDDVNDFVRLEIEAALERRVRVIPILIGNARMPRVEEMPPSLAGLVRRQALELSSNRFQSDTGRLLRVLDKTLAQAQAQREIEAQEQAQREAQIPGGGGQAGTLLRQQGRGGKEDHYRAFWTRFLERVHAEHPDWTTARIPQKDNWITMPSGIKGTMYGCNFAAGGRLRAELYIDGGDAEANLALFRALRARAEAIEAAYGKELSWEELPTRRACRVADYAKGDVTNTDQHNAYIDWFFDTGTRLRRALAPPTEPERPSRSGPFP